MAPQLPSWTEAALSLRLESYPTILLGKGTRQATTGQESEGELLGRYAPAVRGDYLGPEIINSHIGLQAHPFPQRSRSSAVRASDYHLPPIRECLFRKPGFDSLPASINPVIVPQVLSSPPLAWYLLGFSCLPPALELPPLFAWTLLSSTHSGTPTAICLMRWFSSNHPTYCVLFDGEPILGHARIGDVIYSVYNGKPDFLQKMPTREDAPPPHHSSIHGNFMSPTYASPATPYIMFIPSVHPWYGPLLNRLNYKPSGLPIIQFGNGWWGLASSLADEWWTLEINLRRVLYAMMDIAKQRTKGMVPFGWPSRWGYLGKFRTEQSARTAIFHAIRGFLPLIGSVSMYIWYMELQGYLRDSAGEVFAVHDLPDWREAVCLAAGVHRQWLNNLQESAAGDFSVPRIGGILDFSVPRGSFPELVDMPRDFDWIIPAIISTCLPMPLYITWGSISEYPRVFVPFGLRSMKFVPDAAEISYLRDLPGQVAFSRWSSLAILDLPISPLAPFPPVERYSGQHEGENIDAFFLRRQQKNTQTAASETLDNKRRREQREANAQKGQVPGCKGARVFVWEKENGQHIRRAAGRNKYEDVWEEYGPEQRRYDSYYDEWDVCEQFGPAAEPEEDWNDMGGYDGQEDDDVPSEMLAEAAVLQPSGSHTSEVDLDRIHPIVTESESTETGSSTALIAPTFKEMVRLRFGCTVTQEKVTTSLELPEAFLAKKFLGDTAIHISDENQLDHFRLFLAHCKKANSPHDIPRYLLDFHQKESELYSDWAVSVRREVLNNQLCYVISETEQNHHSLHILVQSATTALEIARQGWGPSLRDIVTSLLARGITFLACCRSPNTSPARTGIRRRGYSRLGYRPPNYKPDMRDYHSYVACPWPRSFAIRQYHWPSCGRSEVSSEEVLRGPSDDVLIDGICLWDGYSAAAYWDDRLTGEEIDLICGVYHVATGQYDGNLQNGEQTSTLSWWPRPHSFAASGINFGWWTPMWESWYQKRLQQLENGPGTLATHTQWKHNLKLERRAPPYTAAIEKCAADILATLRP
ncbi:hypothetical protein B0H13DRAFT_1907781 [Mycena leptocephala]|nr:hypothetical protein B0H13DRAFT_1907781 [Mycena leptocephala]